MYRRPDVCFFDYSGLDEEQKIKIDNILYRTDNGAVKLPWRFENSHDEEAVLSVQQDNAAYIHQSAYPISPYTIPTPGMHPVIPQYPMVIRYPDSSSAIVLNPYMPYPFHMPIPPTSGPIAMFMQPNHILSSPYQFACPLPQDIQSSPSNDIPPPEAARSTLEKSFIAEEADAASTQIDNLGLNEMPNCSTKNEIAGETNKNPDQHKDENNSASCIAREQPVKMIAPSTQNLTIETPPPPQVVQAKKPSWASLLSNTKAANEAIIVTSYDPPMKTTTKPNVASKPSERKSHVNCVTTTNSTVTNNVNCINGEDTKFKLISFLRSQKISHRSPSLLPRGLTNRTNWCYVNATLQALLACPPFYHLIKSLNQFSPSMWDALKLPVIKSLAKFVDEFETIQVKATEKFSATKGLKNDIRKGLPFEPDFVYLMLQSIDYVAFKMNQQEDAEEFLSCILNKLHEEMVHILKLDKDTSTLSAPQADPKVTLSLDEESWQQVRSKNRTAFSVNPSSLESSPISNIFRGQICSILQCAGQKDSTSLQPFFTLQLDVQSDKVKSVQDALEQLVSKESLVDYTCNQSKAEVDATQRTLIESLPSVLVLHLKWFTYNKDGGLQKNSKKFDLDVDLEITKDLLSSHAKSRSSLSARKYKLFAVVNHIGHRAVGGHYTVDVYHAGYGTWLRCDDDSITPITQQQVLGFNRPNVPYLVFYRRIDATS